MTSYEEAIANDPTQQAVRERTAKYEAYVAEHGAPPAIDPSDYGVTVILAAKAYSGAFRAWDASPTISHVNESYEPRKA